MSERDFESEAKADGWVPAEEWKGDPEKHVDAETFVRRGEEIASIVNAKNKRLQETVEKLNSEVGELKKGNHQFKEFHDQFVEKAEREAAELRAQLEAKRQKAIDDGDGKAFTTADKQLRDLESQERTRKQETNEMAPETAAWLEKNSWYQDDRGLRALADGFSEQLAKDRPDLVGNPAFLDKLTEMVKEERPDKFENPNRKKSPVDEEGNKGGGGGGGKTFEDLPPEAQDACIRFEKTHGMSRERYLEQYPWD